MEIWKLFDGRRKLDQRAKSGRRLNKKEGKSQTRRLPGGVAERCVRKVQGPPVGSYTRREVGGKRQNE